MDTPYAFAIVIAKLLVAELESQSLMWQAKGFAEKGSQTPKKAAKAAKKTEKKTEKETAKKTEKKSSSKKATPSQVERELAAKAKEWDIPMPELRRRAIWRMSGVGAPCILRLRRAGPGEVQDIAEAKRRRNERVAAEAMKLGDGPFLRWAKGEGREALKERNPDATLPKPVLIEIQNRLEGLQASRRK